MKTLVKFRCGRHEGFKMYSTPYLYNVALRQFLSEHLPQVPQKEMDRLDEEFRVGFWQNEYIYKEYRKEKLQELGIYDFGFGAYRDAPFEIKELNLQFKNISDFKKYFEIQSISIDLAKMIDILFGDTFGVFPF